MEALVRETLKYHVSKTENLRFMNGSVEGLKIDISILLPDFIIAEKPKQLLAVRNQRLPWLFQRTSITWKYLFAP